MKVIYKELFIFKNLNNLIFNNLFFKYGGIYKYCELKLEFLVWCRFRIRWVGFIFYIFVKYVCSIVFESSVRG